MDDKKMSRKWLLTINNPIEKGYTHENLIDIMGQFKGLTYFCLSDEIGKKTETYHTHLFMYCPQGVRFQTIQNRLPNCHIDYCKGTAQQNKDYVFKEGKYSGTDKEDTRVDGTQFEWGEMPVERQGRRNDIVDLYDMIANGMSDFQILDTSPDYMLNLNQIRQTRQVIKSEKFKNTFRQLSTTYIWGSTGSGKTRYVMEKYGYENVYRVTNYKHPFDDYRGQDVVLFDEFRSSLPLADMLKYLDGYPVLLPCRFVDTQACFTKVYFTTNIPLDKQYVNIQRDEIESYKAFLRRIHKVINWDKLSEESQLSFEDVTPGDVPEFGGGSNV
jgi:hypothetical protein